jgi:hypothetical protein
MSIKEVLIKFIRRQAVFIFLGPNTQQLAVTFGRCCLRNTNSHFSDEHGHSIVCASSWRKRILSHS